MMTMRKFTQHRKDSAAPPGLVQPDWSSWLTYFYPLFNALTVTPAMLLSQLQSSPASVALIALNGILAVWYIYRLVSVARNDNDHRRLLCFQLIVVAGMSCLMTTTLLWVHPPDVHFVLKVVVVGNIFAGMINLTSTMVDMILPRLYAQWRPHQHHLPKDLHLDLNRPYDHLALKQAAAVLSKTLKQFVGIEEAHQRATDMMMYLYAKSHDYREDWFGSFRHQKGIERCWKGIDELRCDGHINPAGEVGAWLAIQANRKLGAIAMCIEGVERLRCMPIEQLRDGLHQYFKLKPSAKSVSLLTLRQVAIDQLLATAKSKAQILTQAFRWPHERIREAFSGEDLKIVQEVLIDET